MAKEVDRRAVLKGMTLGVFGAAGIVALGDLWEVITFPNGQSVAYAKAVIVADLPYCSGCRTCEMVCANFNSQGRNGSSLSRIQLEKDYIGGDYQPKVCNQCAEPLCLKACPVAALQVDRQTGTYARVIDERVCIGCRKCVEACERHFQPARPRFDARNKRTIKCHLCFGDPQCVKYCPLGVLRLEKSEAGLRVGFPVVKEV